MAVEQQAQQAFQDCEKYALFDAAGQVLASNFQVRSLKLADSELRARTQT